ncbi:MAG: hypothetical protein ACOYMA_10435 [Bacteroidia bacterium]
MVKLGIIAEGDTETIFLKSNQSFQFLLKDLNIELVKVIDGEGGGLNSSSLLNSKKAILKDAGANKIIVLTDLDELPDFETKKSQLDLLEIEAVIISRKAFEAWFLAETTCIRKAIESNDFYCENPEEIIKPFEEIKRLSIQNRNGRGYGSKPLLAKRMNTLGFDILKVSLHPNCPSAKYFINKLKQIAQI